MRALTALLLGLVALPDVSANEEGRIRRSRSWDLSKDVLGTGNQISFNQGAEHVWYFMESHTLAHNPLIYRFLGEYNAPARPETAIDIPDGFSCWQEPSTVLPDVCFNFNATPVTLGSLEIPARTIDMHPSPDRFSIVAWQSPLNGAIDITGAFGDLDPNCGNGVLWFMDKGSTTLKSGDLDSGATQTFGLADLSVRRGDVLYFIVDPKDGDYFCDSTRLDLIIRRAGHGH